MPSPYNYYCEKCDFYGSSMLAWGAFIYKKGTTEVPINRVIGICYKCDDITPVEKLPNQEHLLKFEKKRKHNFLVDKLLNEEKKRKKLLSNRTSKARCLRCASHNFDVIPTIKSETSSFISGKPYPTGYKHRNCGGEIIIKKSLTNFFMGNKLPTKFYNLEGIEINGT